MNTEAPNRAKAVWNAVIPPVRRGGRLNGLHKLCPKFSALRSGELF